jgi:hypothetical protein
MINDNIADSEQESLIVNTSTDELHIYSDIIYGSVSLYIFVHVLLLYTFHSLLKLLKIIYIMLYFYVVLVLQAILTNLMAPLRSLQKNTCRFSKTIIYSLHFQFMVTWTMLAIETKNLSQQTMSTFPFMVSSHTLT